MPSSAHDDTMCFGDFELRPGERVLLIRGAPVTLGSRAFDLLLAFAQHRGRVVTKQELLDLVWPGLIVEEHNIATQGRGYRFTAPPGDPAIGSVLSHGVTAAAEPASVPTRLPRRLMPWLGRADDLAALDELLKRSRLVTLAGAGGIASRCWPSTC